MSSSPPRRAAPYANALIRTLCMAANSQIPREELPARDRRHQAVEHDDPPLIST